MDAHSRGADIIAFINEQHYSLFEAPVRLADIRAKMAAIREFAGSDLLERSILGQIVMISMHYVPLSERIALYHREMEVYHEHIRKGDFDARNYRNVRVSEVFELCEAWMHRYHRYPYGDVRKLRPFITDLLAEVADWDRVPDLVVKYMPKLEQWHEDLAPGGELYPSDEHLAYAERFEASAEDIIWDSRGQEHITIRNFPAPPRVWPRDCWWHTQHLLS